MATCTHGGQPDGGLNNIRKFSVHPNVCNKASTNGMDLQHVSFQAARTHQSAQLGKAFQNNCQRLLKDLHCCLIAHILLPLVDQPTTYHNARIIAQGTPATWLTNHWQRWQRPMRGKQSLAEYETDSVVTRCVFVTTTLYTRGHQLNGTQSLPGCACWSHRRTALYGGQHACNLQVHRG